MLIYKFLKTRNILHTIVLKSKLGKTQVGLFYVLLDTFLYCLKIFPTMYINFMMKNTKKCFYLFIYFWSRLVACNILVPQPQTEAMPLAVKVRSPNPWIAKEFLKKCLKILNNFHSMTRPWFRIPFSNKRNQRSLGKQPILGLGQGKFQMSLQYLVMLENKKEFKK